MFARPTVHGESLRITNTLDITCAYKHFGIKYENLKIMRIREFFTHRRIMQRLAKLERKVERLKSILGPKENLRFRILEMFHEPRTRSEIAKDVGKCRSWVSKILNDLEKRGHIKEVGRRGRTLLYQKVERAKKV